MAARSRGLLSGGVRGGRVRGDEDEDDSGEFVLPSKSQEVRAPVVSASGGKSAPQWGYHKLALVVEYVEEHCEVGNPESVLNTIEAFATGVGSWLKVAGGAKAPLIETAAAGRPLHEDELMIEFGTFIGYTATRLSWRNMLAMGGRSVTPFKGPRMISIEVDPINAFVARHIIDLGMLLCYIEVWTGQIKDVIPRILEVWGERSLAFSFLDYKGSRYHVDFAKWEQLDLLAPFSRLVADNTISPGAPLLLWNLRHSPAVSSTNWALQEFLEEAIEDWMAVFDYDIPAWGPREKHPSLAKEEEWEDSWANWDGREWKDEWNEENQEVKEWTGEWPDWKG